jgi:hypothetical protein
VHGLLLQCARFPFHRVLHQDGSYPLNSACKLSPTSPDSLSCHPTCSFGDELPPTLTCTITTTSSCRIHPPQPWRWCMRPSSHPLLWNQVPPTMEAMGFSSSKPPHRRQHAADSITVSSGSSSHLQCGDPIGTEALDFYGRGRRVMHRGWYPCM